MDTITITVENKPAPYLTAKEAHTMAVSWENEELKACLTVITNNVCEIAKKGGLSGSFPVRGGRPCAFYDTLEQGLRSLGYEVESPVYPWTGEHKHWILKW